MDVYEIEVYGRIGLQRMAHKVLGKVMQKLYHVTMSDWDAEELMYEQVEYACIDAFMSFELGLKLFVVIAKSKWKEEGHPVRKYELNRIVRELRKHKRYKYALEVCEWMRVQDDIQLLSGDYAVYLDLITKVHGMNSAEKFFEDLPDRLKVQTTYTALLHTYVQHKDTAKAESLMEKMSDAVS
ncbi:hypothetical protein MTR67_000920 [Solanum verrucosum]|uniref:Pentatricopeptide repeat-containing protein n=1 Tax=Solanum verrucosum TaxID=315347 RepID=A0AAF0PPG7_SOLVR|nr:hypothetical protein MTR67_000920 [Solanum verrucosum]